MGAESRVFSSAEGQLTQAFDHTIVSAWGKLKSENERQADIGEKIC
jgi:hypothetical protein